MKLSASKIDLARRCLWAFRPDAGPRNTSSFAAAAGNDEHAHIEHTLTTGDLAPASPTHARWLREWYEANAAPGWIVERPVAMDPRTGETRLGPGGWDRRDYAWAGGFRFIAGTPDAYRVDGRTLRVCDWKTGEAAHVKDPGTNGQLLFLACALARHFGCLTANVELVLVNERRLWVEAAQVSRLDLEVFRREVVGLLTGADGNPEPVPGHWCKSMFCDYLGRCPATSMALAQAHPAPARFMAALHSGDFQSPEHVGYQWWLVGAAEKRLAEMKTAAVMWLKAEPGRAAPLPHGGIVEMETGSRESIIPEAAEPVLREHFGAMADECIETKVSITKGRVEDVAAERRREGETKAAARRRVMEALRAAGAVKVSEYQSPREREAPAQIGRPEASDGARDDAA